MNFRMANIVTTIWAAMWMSACGSTEPMAVEERAQAKTLIQQAEAAGAAEFAPDALASARENLQEAELSMRDEKTVLAQQSAERAVVDAKLALVTTEQAKSQKAADELKRSMESLRRESERPANQEPDPVADQRP